MRPLLSPFYFMEVKMSVFDYKTIEKKWQKFWEDNETFKTDVNDFSKPKFYALDMFPYPSGVGLHAGHPEGYTATDVVSRYKRMKGFNVLHPMGFDSFGLPAEQYAIQTGNHPAGFTQKNIDHFTEQLKGLGFSYDWSKVVSTSDPDYYKWTQWIFKQLFLDGYARCVEMPVNWCEELGCVLANDEVIDGKSERGGYPVIRKNMKQWIIDIPAYAEKLLANLDTLDWPESTKEIQRNWIGKSIGAEVKFKIDGTDEDFTVFTTRCDTLFGATYCVLSPEHPLVDKITTADKKAEVEAYKKECASKSEMERTELNKDKTGVFSGSCIDGRFQNSTVRQFHLYPSKTLLWELFLHLRIDHKGELFHHGKNSRIAYSFILNLFKANISVNNSSRNRESDVVLSFICIIGNSLA